MKVLQLYNRYRVAGHGEDRVVAQTLEVLQSKGVEATLLEASGWEARTGFVGKLKAALASPYSRQSYKRARRRIQATRADVVHAHNIYPLLTPSVLRASRDAGIPTVLTAHNYYLTCPVYTHLSRGITCTRCTGGHEYHCITRNCRSNLAESVVYAARAAIVRKWRLIHDNTCQLIALSTFASKYFEAAGFTAEQIAVLPNSVPIPKDQARPQDGKYVAFGGRLTHSKGIDILMGAARQTGLPIRIAGSVTDAGMPLDDTPANVTLLGPLTRMELRAFYCGARFLVFPSRWFEMCPMMVLEAMSHGLPVIASRIGGLDEIVLDGETGVLCKPGDTMELAVAMQRLWDDPMECARLGLAARARAKIVFNEDNYFDKLIRVYRRAINRGFPLQ
jgi:glycosyltransferase involved in cell wall biosynthesis